MQRTKILIIIAYVFFSPLKCRFDEPFSPEKPKTMGYKTNENEETPRCLECGDTLNYGRSDRKFCGAKCKNAYHNRRTHDIRAVHYKVVGCINRNYEILDKLVKLGISSIDIPDVVQMGFSPDYSTSYHKVRTHDEFRCYEIKYFMTQNRLFNICRTLK